MKEIFINSEYIKLTQFLKFAGISGSGAEAGILVKEGKVSINDELCFEKGKKLTGGEIISLNGEEYKVSRL